MVNILNRSEMVMNNEYLMDIIKRRELAINALCDMDTDRKFEFRIDAFLQNVKRGGRCVNRRRADGKGEQAKIEAIVNIITLSG